VILFINPRATRPGNRRFPLSLMAVGAALPADVGWEIVDGNLPDMDVPATIARIVR
jgi:anaerobic magnesium-protoporphyrin IX monomethyl ester cyclase